MQHATSSTAWEGWRAEFLDRHVPSHIRWRTSSDKHLQKLPSHLARGRCTFRVSQAIHLYEARKFKSAERLLREVLAVVPEHDLVMCRLADTLYARAGSMKPPPDPRSPQERSGSANRSQSQESTSSASSMPPPSHGTTVLSTEVRVSESLEDSTAREDGEANPDSHSSGPDEGARSPDAGTGSRQVHRADSRSVRSGASHEELRDRLLTETQQLYCQALAQNPKSSHAVNGMALFAECREDKIRLLERAVALDGQNSYALANLGGELLGDDDRRALHCLDQALAVNPKLFYARIYRSKALIRLGSIDGAISSTREQLQWRPRDMLARRLLAQLENQRELLQRRMLLV